LSTEALMHEEAAAPARDWQSYPSQDDGAEHTVVGTVKKLEALYSPQLDNRRDVLVYLPPSYGTDAERRYPVLYMHDGQNLFDRATSFGAEWEVDQTLEAASEDGLEAIVVGLLNLGDARLDEYSPWPDEKHAKGGRGDLYLDFIVQTVKPIIDADFRTRPDRRSTGIAGSSMGGLISLYGYFRNHDTFGFCGVMSPALWYGGRKIYEFVEKGPLRPWPRVRGRRHAGGEAGAHRRAPAQGAPHQKGLPPRLRPAVRGGDGRCPQRGSLGPPDAPRAALPTGRAAEEAAAVGAPLPLPLPQNYLGEGAIA
jgi:predicted alpha/beta superfamily hydrolase